MRLDVPTKKLLRDPAARKAWVKFQLSLRDLSLAELARDAGVTRQCVYQVFNNRYPRMEKLVAEALGLKAWQLFPERYNQKTKLPNSRLGRPRAANSAKTVSKNSIKQYPAASSRHAYG